MINKIKIKNFKSIEDLEFELGKLNVIIGANGSGKTNILEAIVMGAAASASKLDYEFLGNRIRITSPEFMRNAFPNTTEKEIQLKFYQENKEFFYKLINDKNDYRKWIEINRTNFQTETTQLLMDLISGDKNLLKELEDDDAKSFLASLNTIRKKDSFSEGFSDIIPVISDKIIKDEFSLNEISEFLIYTPELSYLRRFEEFSQITPLGVKGEGLFNLLKQILSNKRKKKQITDIKNNLHLLDWFDDFDIPENLMSNEFKIAIKDRFIKSELNYFDQSSSNEGFLYLLFYLVLFTGEKTPPFFAIDNIETGFNPKLCTELIKVLNKLSKKYKKQVIITTHNPAILDGLNINDDNQRLFVARRNKKGKTQIERITQKTQSKMRLSELWTKGFIGGIPDNF
jgi:predicted ATPase